MPKGTSKPNKPNKAKKQQQKKKSPGLKIKGQGSYTVAGLAAKVAKMLPKGTFETAGSHIGAALGRGLSNFTGVGDYVFNEIVHTPSMPRKDASRTQRISNCEYITDLTSVGGTAFTTSTFNINPYESNVFPWLAKLGRLYTKFKMVQLIFEFRSNTSDYAANGPLGTVIMAPLYNVDSPTFVSKQQMEAAQHAVSTKPSNSIMCGVECSPADDAIKWHWIRTAGQTATNLTDHSKFVIATSGLPTASTGALGEIWIHYTIDLLDPILTNESLAVAGTNGCLINWNSTTAGLLANGFAGMVPGTVQLGNRQEMEGQAYRDILTNIAGRPTVPYFISVDAAANNGRDWYFNAPGDYFVTYSIMTTSTVIPNGNRQVYDPVIKTGIATATLLTQPMGTVSGVVMTAAYLVRVATQDACITWNINSTYTNLATVGLNGTAGGQYGSVVRVVLL